MGPAAALLLLASLALLGGCGQKGPLSLPKSEAAKPAAAAASAPQQPRPSAP